MCMCTKPTWNIRTLIVWIAFGSTSHTIYTHWYTAQASCNYNFIYPHQRCISDKFHWNVREGPAIMSWIIIVTRIKDQHFTLAQNENMVRVDSMKVKGGSRGYFVHKLVAGPHKRSQDMELHTGWCTITGTMEKLHLIPVVMHQPINQNSDAELDVPQPPENVQLTE